MVNFTEIIFSLTEATSEKSVRMAELKDVWDEYHISPYDDDDDGDEDDDEGGDVFCVSSSALQQLFPSQLSASSP